MMMMMMIPIGGVIISVYDITVIAHIIYTVINGVIDFVVSRRRRNIISLFNSHLYYIFTSRYTRLVTQYNPTKRCETTKRIRVSHSVLRSMPFKRNASTQHAFSCRQTYYRHHIFVHTRITHVIITCYRSITISSCGFNWGFSASIVYIISYCHDKLNYIRATIEMIETLSGLSCKMSSDR